MYSKVAKYISWALLIIGILICVLGFACGFESSNAAFVDTLLYFGYIMVALSIVGILALGIYNGAKGNPKGLLKALIIVVCAVVIIGVVYLIAPGNEAVGYNGLEQTKSTLKLTDTILYLTYAFIGATIVAIIVSAIVSATRK
ncbi:MAG: hypothetical protein LUC24_06280 [Bacteroidales bacterium]|nr:hypothetical protein [Bacteroidales bacterium]